MRQKEAGPQWSIDVSISDRMFSAPPPDLAKISARLARLPPRLSATVEHAGNALATNDLRTAQLLLANALSIAPGQPDVLRLYGLLLANFGNLPAAYANFEAALRAAPDDAMGYWQFAQVCEQVGDITSALRLRERAVEVLPESPMAWADLGEHWARHQQSDRALAALERATALAPDYPPALLKLGDVLVSCGRAEEGAAAMRRAIGVEPAFGAAWLNLVDVKTIPITDDEVDQMRTLVEGGLVDESERTAIKFALGKACEDRGLYGEAFALFVDANATRKREVSPWNIEQFRYRSLRAQEIFTMPIAGAENPRLGEQLIFIVGMPRSGTTLIEQILASHPEVRGMGELGELAQVLTEESSRLRRHYPEWVPEASPQDWQRLGLRYLQLTERFRDGHAYYTDKMPNNWQAIGAIRAMLPGARIVICRRDPLENCWSCFRQFFTSGWEFTYDIEQLGMFWKTFDRAAQEWVGRDPEHVREQGYEILTEQPADEIRSLLSFCGVPFDPACLAFHRSSRPIHTLSAAQVRQPMRRHSGTAVRYGAMLDPLRLALGMAPLAQPKNAITS